MTPAEFATTEDKCLAVRRTLENEVMINGLKFEDAANKVAEKLQIRIATVYLACALTNEHAASI